MSDIQIWLWAEPRTVVDLPFCWRIFFFFSPCCQQVLEWTGPGPAGIKKTPSLQSPGQLAAPRPGTLTPRRPWSPSRVCMENSERSRRTPRWPRTSVRWVWVDETVYLRGEDTLQQLLFTLLLFFKCINDKGTLELSEMLSGGHSITVFQFKTRLRLHASLLRSY